MSGPPRPGLTARSRWLVVTLAAWVAGAIVAGLVVAAALDHNPQGEFADPQTGAWTADTWRLGALSFGAGFVPSWVLGLALTSPRRRG